MSFSRAEILQEFDEAARLGRRGDPIAYVEMVLEERAARGTARKRLARPWRMATRPIRRVYTVKPFGEVHAFPCLTCGARCELREGTKRVIHTGPPTSCRLRAA